jgi:hypothetical protein
MTRSPGLPGLIASQLLDQPGFQHQFLFEFVAGFEALGHDTGFRIKAGPA